MSLTFATLQAEVARLGGIDEDDEAATAAAWTTGGLRAIGRAGAWPWLRAALDISGLTAGDYDYALPSDFFRLKTKSLRYAGKDTYLKWASPERIDVELGPEWKDAGTANGSPSRATRMGSLLWIAPKPSAAFVADYTHIYGYYFRTEPTTGTLYLPDEFAEIAVHAALAYGFIQEEDPRAEKMLDRFKKVYLPEMMGATLELDHNDHVEPTDWMRLSYDGERAYGDG